MQQHTLQGLECILGSAKFDQRRDPKPFAGLFFVAYPTYTSQAGLSFSQSQEKRRNMRSDYE
jgi:hypothetical protein